MIARTILPTALALLAIVAGCTPSSMGRKGCPTTPEGVQPAIVGTHVPDLALFTPDGKKVVTDELFAAKPTVLVIYRGNWCLYCQKELEKMASIEPQLRGLGYQIVAVSPDSPKTLQKAIAKRDLGYQLLSDPQMKASEALGIAYAVDEDTRLALDRYGAEPQPTGNSMMSLPVPAVFIVSQAGVIRFEYVNPNFKEQVDPDVLLSAAKCIATNKE